MSSKAGAHHVSYIRTWRESDYHLEKEGHYTSLFALMRCVYTDG
jgi:hypothetical protein